MAMQALRKVVEVSGDSVTVDLPPEWRLQKLEVIVLPVDELVDTSKQRSSWETFVRQTYGSIPDFPDREPQGDFENRRSLDD